MVFRDREGIAHRMCSGPVWQGLYTDSAQGLGDRECIQTVRRFWVTGIVYRQCAGSGWQGLYTDSAQGLGDRDCTQTVRRFWVTGTVYRQCAGSGWQGLYKDSGQGLGDNDSTWHRTSVKHSVEVKGRTVSSRSCYRELRISCFSCTACRMFWRSNKWKSSPLRPNPVHKLQVPTFKSGKLQSNMEIGMNPCSTEWAI